MPSKRKNKKGKSSPKGRGRATRKTKRAKQVTVVPGNSFEADAERVRLRYSDQYLVIQGASGGTLTNYPYKLNSLFNVNVNASAGTYQGTASLSAKFKKYLITGSRIRWQFRFMQPGGSYGALGALGVAPTNSGLFAATMYPVPTAMSTSTTLVNAGVQKYAVKRFDWPRTVPVIALQYEPTQINPRETWSGRHSMSVAKLDGEPMIRQDAYEANFGADPARLQYWAFALQDLLADTTVKGVWLAEVDMEADVFAYERNNIGDVVAAGPLCAIIASPQEEKAPAPSSPDTHALVEPDITPQSFPLAYGYELVKRKPLAALGALRS